MNQLDSEASLRSPERPSNPIPFVLPLIVYMAIAYRYPDVASSMEGDIGEPDGSESSLGMTREMWWYMALVGAQVVIISGLLIWFRRVYLDHFSFRISPLSVLVGVVGVMLWVGLCQLELEPRLLVMLGWDASRPEFNPFAIDDQSILALFLALRFSLLVLIVPVVEELFLRGWLVRWIENPDWETVGLQGLSAKALLAASIYGVLTHPSEALAAFTWFGLVTWLMNRTGNLWDCIVAHAVTNLLLGIYVLKFEQWQLW